MRIKVRGVCLALVLLLIPGLLMAGITGKITGRVRDASTKEPLPLVNVIVKQRGESVTGDATGTDGTYVISNLTAGEYTLEFSMIGYQTVVVENVKVTADQITKQDASLKSSAIEVGEVVITAQRDPLNVKPPAITGTEINRQGGVDNYQDVVRLQAGATETSSGYSSGLHIQGGRTNEVVYVVDGINANDPVTGQSGVYIDNTAIQEMTINTGSFNAEYGDAMSAVVNIVTREGSQNFEGTAEYETDAHLRLSKDPIKYPNKDMWHNKGSLSIGGPLGLPRSSFFVSGNILEHEDRLPFNDQHRKNGTLKLAWRPFEGGAKFTLAGNYSNQWYHAYSHAYSKGIWLSMGPRVQRDNYQLNLKVNHPISDKVSYTVNVGTFNTHTKISYMDGAHYNDFRMIGRMLMDWVTWAYQRTWWEDLNIADTIVGEEGDTSYVTADGDTTTKTRAFRRLYDADSMKFVFTADSTFPIVEDSDTTWVNPYDLYGNITKDPDSLVWFYYNQYQARTGYLIDKDSVFRWVDLESQLEALNWRWYEVNEWRPTLDENGDTVGVYYHLFDFDRYKEMYNNYRNWTDTTQENPYEDSLESSGNMYYVRYNSDPVFRRYQYYFYPRWSDRNTTKYVADASVDWNPNKIHWFRAGVSGNYHLLDYDDIQFTNENPYSDTYHKEPIIAAAFVQDRVEYEDLEFDVGVRFDYFNPSSDYFVDPENIDAGSAPAKAKFQFSPRVSISFAVSEKSKMHASYGHFFQPVELGELYQNLEADITTGVPLLGNPNLPPLKTVFYQAGYKYMISKDMVFELKGYYKDQENLLATRNVSTIYKGELATYTVYVIEDFAKVKGVDVGLVRSAPRFLSWNITYSFMDAKGTGSSGREFYYRYRDSSLEPPKHEYPLEFDITHSVKANLNFYLDQKFNPKFLRMTNLNIQFNYASGAPYWATDSRGNVLPMGSKRMPATKTVDAKLEKWFPIGKNQKLSLGAYIDVRNVFDWQNVANVYSGTGLPDDNAGTPVYEAANYRDYEEKGFASEYENWQADVADWESYVAQNPTMFGSPRELRFGIRMSF